MATARLEGVARITAATNFQVMLAERRGPSTCPAPISGATLVTSAGERLDAGCCPNSADAAIQYAEQDGGLTRVLAYQAAEAIKAQLR